MSVDANINFNLTLTPCNCKMEKNMEAIYHIWYKKSNLQSMALILKLILPVF